MPARLRLALFVAGLLALTAIAAVLLFAVGERAVPPPGFAGATRPPGIPRADFGLRDERGDPVRLADMRGKPVVVTFLYTTCKDTCPLTASRSASPSTTSATTCRSSRSASTRRTTPRARARSSCSGQGLQGRMRWALGSDAELQRLWRAYGIQPQTDDAEHTASTVLLDKRGVQRVGFAASVLTPDALAHDIALLEREGEAGAS